MQQELAQCDVGIADRLQAEVESLKAELESTRAHVLRADTSREQIADQLHAFRTAALRYRLPAFPVMRCRGKPVTGWRLYVCL